MTKLQEALMAAGIRTLDYTDAKTDKVFTVQIADVPDETIVSQLHYGRRMFNDALNSGDQDKRDERRAELEKRIVNGWTRGHGGGKSLSEFERVAREQVKSFMVEDGHKASEATKLISKLGAEAAFRKHIGDEDALWQIVVDHVDAIVALKTKLPSLK